MAVAKNDHRTLHVASVSVHLSHVSGSASFVPDGAHSFEVLVGVLMRRVDPQGLLEMSNRLIVCPVNRQRSAEDVMRARVVGPRSDRSPGVKERLIHVARVEQRIRQMALALLGIDLCRTPKCRDRLFNLASADEGHSQIGGPNRVVRTERQGTRGSVQWLPRTFLV